MNSNGGADSAVLEDGLPQAKSWNHHAVQGIDLIFNTTELAIYATEWTVGCQFWHRCGLILQADP